MRFFRMFLLNFQNVFEYRARSFVWFIIGLIGPFTMILFWNGASQNSHGQLHFSEIASYYLLLIPVGITLTSHVEEDIAYEDIKDGMLTKYLTKPYPFYWMKFLEESPYRLLQGFYGIIIVLLTIFFFPWIGITLHGFLEGVVICSILGLGYLLSLTYKLCVGLIAFWITDIGGFLQFENMIWFVFGGYMMPLHLLPLQISNFSYTLPFAYILYYPVRALQGDLSISQLFFVLFIQMCWLVGLIICYKILWYFGIRKYTAIGQ